MDIELPVIDDRDPNIDLHMHSTYSDGALTPEELVKRNLDLGMTEIALTDHDGTGGIPEFLAAGKKYGLRVHTGIEFGTLYEGKYELHILGYDFDPENPGLNDQLEDIRNYRHRRNLKLLKVFQDKGYDLTWDDLVRFPGQTYIGKPNFAEAFRDMGLVSTVSEAFASKELLSCPESLALRKKAVDPKDAVRWIRDAGGFTVWAHPMKVRRMGEKGSEEYFRRVEEIAEDLRAAGLAGLECRHPSADESQAERLEQIADRLGMLRTRGSDFHGID